MAFSYINISTPSRAFAYEALTVDNTAGGVGVTAGTAFPQRLMGNGGATGAGSYQDQSADLAMFTVETDQVRYTLDGTAPTSTVGHLLNVGDVLSIEGRDQISRVKFIRVTTTASVRVTYFRRT